MIELKELLKGAKFESLPVEVQWNLNCLLIKLNKIADLYKKPMIVTSGLRTLEDHLRIYREKAAKEGKSFNQQLVPMKSKHLTGGAADISDPKKELQKWCLDNQPKLQELKLWCEDFAYTPNWVHFQVMPPKSGKLFFIP